MDPALSVVLSVLVAACLVVGYVAGRVSSQDAARENTEKIDLALDHLRTSRGIETTLSSVVSKATGQRKALESLEQKVERMDLSMGKIADILVQQGQARIMEFDAQTGEPEYRRIVRRRADPEGSTVIPGGDEAPT